MQLQLLDNLPSYSKDSFSALEEEDANTPNNKSLPPPPPPPRRYIATHAAHHDENMRTILPEKVSSLIRAIAAGNKTSHGQEKQGEERAAKRVRFGRDQLGTTNDNNNSNRRYFVLLNTELK